jgi:hypothetical protein
MKKIFLLLLSGICIHAAAIAQCDKNVVINSSRTEYMDSTGVIERTVDENSTVEIKGKEIIITPGNEDNTMRGAIKTMVCEWKVPFKEGKTVITTDLTRNGASEAREATITIEGKDGKLTLIARSPQFPNRLIRLNIDHFAESK